MTQATNSTQINSTTPIRIGSFHSSNTTTGTGTNHHQHSDPQQSSSVPTVLGQLQSQSSLAGAGVSNQSITSSIPAAGLVGSSLTPPSSAGPRQTSGGITHWGSDNREKYDGNQTDKTPTDTSKLNRKESYKAQRKNYRREKKRVASELLHSLQDPAVIVLADWLKIRGTLKSWTKLWCVLKPGLMLIYKSPKTKSSHWVGTVLLSSCKIIERPSKKDGFCFKLFHPMEQSIWAPRGPDKETIGAVIQPLPTSYLIFRAPSQAAGKCWMDALELSLRCTALLLRSNSNSGAVQDVSIVDTAQISHETQWSEADYEKHFNEQGSCSSARPSPYHELQKRYAQYLTVPEGDNTKSTGSSEISLNSRSPTPILHQLYMTMQNWERQVANTTEFQKIKSLKRLYKHKHSDAAASCISSIGDMSYASSSEDSPRKYPRSHRSVKFKKRRFGRFTKSVSLNSALNRSSSSEDAVEVTRPKRSSSARPISAPPGVLQPFILNVKGSN